MSDQNQLHVLITGGSRGLGLATVRDLLSRGYVVSTCSRQHSSDLSDLESHNPGLRWYEADLTQDGQAGEFVERAVADRPSVRTYGLINNAGIAGEGVLPTFPMVDARTIVTVNLISTLEASRSFLRALLSARLPGRIINISSIIGTRGYNGLSVYSASKAGMDGMTRALAREWGRTGTTVNSIAPGYLETDMSASLEAGQRDQVIRRTPLGRLGTTDDVVPLVAYLLSREAQFITGQTLVIDGGISC
jgi:3-oxoacyl-[acyl-carrier protein] reductase